MGISRVFNWFREHNNAIEAIFDIASDLIPGANVVKGTLKMALGKKADEEEKGLDEKLKELENFLLEIRPLLINLVEEVEENKNFQKAQNETQRKNAIEKEEELQKELKRILPQFSESISRSVNKLNIKRNKQILNERYQLDERIGKGGQGEVFRALHLHANMEVAIKILPATLSKDEQAKEKIRQEYTRLIRDLICEHIIQYRELGYDEKIKQYYLVMDYVRGRNLRNLLLEKKQKRSCFRIEEALQILMPIAKALDHAHKQGIVHCDLKPENILLRESSAKVYLTDFGLSHQIIENSAEEITSEEINGTLPYMAPEQYLGIKISIATDAWAFGVILYEMLSGSHPFHDGESFEEYQKLICRGEIKKCENLSEERWKILQKFLEKNADQRPIELEKTLEKFANCESKNIAKELPTELTEIKDEIPAELRKYWDSENSCLDFTSKEWESLSVEKQRENASKYQDWYAKEYNGGLKEKKVGGIEMLLIPPGKFWMGSPKNETSRGSDEVKHKVLISNAFWCGKYAVTQSQWQGVMGSNPSKFKGSNRPVEQVSWEECKVFCNETGMRLLTEAEWEYACRGGTTSAYNFGNEAENLNEYIWYSGNSKSETHSVGEKKANAFGLYDMHGNVWEWCEDWYGSYSNGEVKDPIGASSGSYRVNRGGSWNSNAGICRSAFRGWNDPTYRYTFLGLRLSGS